MATNNDFDLAVVGYGPVGQMTSILLGELGYRVGVFDRWPDIYPLPRAVHYDDEIARLMSPTADPREALDAEQLAFLDDLGAHLVRVAPEGRTGDGAVVDLEGKYAEWFREAGAAAIVVRPDFYVYGTVAQLLELPELLDTLRNALRTKHAKERSRG